MKYIKKKIHFSSVIQLGLSLLIFIFSAIPAGVVRFTPPVYADGPVPGVDCSENWPSWPVDHECYIRGMLSPASGWSTGGGCWITHRITYTDGSDAYWNFCLAGGSNHPLTNRDAIMKVQFVTNTAFQVIEQLSDYANYNQTPAQPNLHRPQSGWELGPRTNGSYTGVTCNTAGTGAGCNVQFSTTTNDPDYYQWLNSTFEVRSSQGGNRDYSRNNNGTENRNITLPDGNWNWRGISADAYTNSGWTSRRYFVVDTTAPSLPNMITEPAFTPGVQNTVQSSVSTDNIIGGVQYFFEIATDSSFTNSINNSGWINTNQFTFAGLTNETEYFYRVKARDGLWNETNWSNTTSSIQDDFAPQITSVSNSQAVISPANNDGANDVTQLSVSFIEKYNNQVEFRIINSANNTVYQQVKNTSALPQDGSEYFETEIWDGTYSSSYGTGFVPDGAYTIQVFVRDLAGNETLDDTQNIIVDNQSPNLTINQLMGAWFNTNSINISGQTEADAALTIENQTTTQFQNITVHPVNGLFGTGNTDPAPVDPLISFGLDLGINQFEFIATDPYGNITTENREYLYEIQSPVISINSPSGVIINPKEPITLTLTDTGFNQYISGIDVSSINLFIQHDDFAEDQIVTNGNSVSPLGNVSTDCNGSGTYGQSGPESCTFSFNFTSDLDPNGNYTIRAEASDIAGNVAASVFESFELDSNTYNVIESPVDNALLNYSLTSISGEAEENATISISIPDVDGDLITDTETFVVSESASNASRVTVSNCRSSVDPTQDGIKRICDYTIASFQLERDSVNPGVVTNPITFETADNYGNIDTQVLNIDVDLFAVNLAISSDLEFFSPNGDGAQDGVRFESISTDAVVDTWNIIIEDEFGSIVKDFNGLSTPPSDVPWDGTYGSAYGSGYVPDGTYSYYLDITTTDGVTFQTSPQILTAVTDIQNSVVITYPKHNSFTTRGLTTVQGQAPQNTVVKICADIIGVAGTCDTEVYSEVDANGLFSTIMPLYRLPNQSVTEFIISATANDKYGNTTPESNRVTVSSTVEDPFESVSIIPAFSGVNNQADYQIILDKLNSGQEITQADIDSLRTVIFRSTVNQGNERVKFGFSDVTDLSALPDTISSNYIGYIDGSNQTRLYSPFVDGITSFTNCSSTTCTWDFYYPVPPTMGGLYEVSFEGKIGSTVQTLTTPVTIDGNIPTAPIILDVDKLVGGVSQNTNVYDNAFYSNEHTISIKGFSDANAAISITDQNGTTICNTTASPIGLFVCEVDVSTIYAQPEVQLDLDVIATLGANTSTSLETTTVFIDTLQPQFNTVDYTQWHNSGNVVETTIDANENLSYVRHVDLDAADFSGIIENVTTQNSDCRARSTGIDFGIFTVPIQLGANTDFTLQTDNSNAVGAFTINGNAEEGRYCTVVEIEDRAGNKNALPITNFIDNTLPDKPVIDTSTWGLFNGINTSPGFIAEGRIVPEYVHEEDSVRLLGYAESGMTIEAYVNNKLIQSYVVDSSNDATCVLSKDVNGNDLTTDTIFDTVTVEEQYQCIFDFSFDFDDEERDYVFQVKTIDLAGNESIISEDELIYLDQSAPRTPESTGGIKSNGSGIVDWIVAKNTDVVATTYGTGNFGKLPVSNDKNVVVTSYSEAYADMQYMMFDPLGNINTVQLHQNTGSGFKDLSYYLKQGDGVYTLTTVAVDAAGNYSDTHLMQMELDTVAPAKPQVDGDMASTYTIYMEVIGEPGSWSSIGQLNQNGYASGIVKTLDINKDSDWETTMTFCSNLQDRAGNISGRDCFSVTTPVRPPRVGECEADLNTFYQSPEFINYTEESSIYSACTQGTDYDEDGILSQCSYVIQNSTTNHIFDLFDNRSCKRYLGEDIKNAISNGLTNLFHQSQVHNCMHNYEGDGHVAYETNASHESGGLSPHIDYSSTLVAECDVNGVYSLEQRQVVIDKFNNNNFDRSYFYACLNGKFNDFCEKGSCSSGKASQDLLNACSEDTETTLEEWQRELMIDSLSDSYNEHKKSNGRGVFKDCGLLGFNCWDDGIAEAWHWTSQAAGLIFTFSPVGLVGTGLYTLAEAAITGDVEFYFDDTQQLAAGFVKTAGTTAVDVVIGTGEFFFQTGMLIGAGIDGLINGYSFEEIGDNFEDAKVELGEDLGYEFDSYGNVAIDAGWAGLTLLSLGGVSLGAKIIQTISVTGLSIASGTALYVLSEATIETAAECVVDDCSETEWLALTFAMNLVPGMIPGDTKMVRSFKEGADSYEDAAGNIIRKVEYENFLMFRKNGLKLDWDDYLTYRHNIDGSLFDAALNKNQLEATLEFAKRDFVVNPSLMKKTNFDNVVLSEFNNQDIGNIFQVIGGGASGVPFNPKNIKNISGDLKKLDLNNQELKALTEHIKAGRKFDVDNYNFLIKNENVNNINTLDDYLTNDLGRFSKRELELGIDPDRGILSKNEIDSALRIEKKLGISLERSQIGDWKDNQGIYYDAIGPVENPSLNFDFDSFTNSITEKHLYNPSKSEVSTFVVDMTGHPVFQIEEIKTFIQNLDKLDQERLIFIH